LFDHYIPRAWTIFLETLAQKDEVDNIFSSWPPEQRSLAASGEGGYWKSLPSRVFTFIASSGLSIWPTYQIQSNRPHYRPLGDLLISEPSIPTTVLRTLAKIGLQLTCPPQYIVDVIKFAGDARFKILTPDKAHGALLVSLFSKPIVFCADALLFRVILTLYLRLQRRTDL
jgi:hypothetical protein